MDIHVPITLTIKLHDNQENYVKEIDLDSKFDWNENEYVWFSVKGIAGGTDAYCKSIKDEELDPDNPWWWFDDMIYSNKTIKNLEDKIEKAKKMNKSWTFRRSIGQECVINVAYGIISASIAELTNGFIWTDDGAWNFEKFPCEPIEFYKWYFKPNEEEDPGYKEFSTECVKFFKSEFYSS